MLLLAKYLGSFLTNAKLIKLLPYLRVKFKTNATFIIKFLSNCILYFKRCVTRTLLSARCYVENLENREAISADTKRITYNGGTLQVQCVEGFSSIGNHPKCVNGEWEKHQPLCKESKRLFFLITI